jgi:hypothetical protein
LPSFEDHLTGTAGDKKEEIWGEVMSYYSEIITSFWKIRRLGGNLENAKKTIENHE